MKSVMCFAAMLVALAVGTASACPVQQVQAVQVQAQPVVAAQVQYQMVAPQVQQVVAAPVQYQQVQQVAVPQAITTYNVAPQVASVVVAQPQAVVVQHVQRIRGGRSRSVTRVGPFGGSVTRTRNF